MRGRCFITVVGIGGVGMWCRTGMELGWGMWGMAGRVMDGWMRMIPDTGPDTGLEMIRATSLDMETMGLTRLGRIRMGRV
jgi:hypothetical protein